MIEKCTETRLSRVSGVYLVRRFLKTASIMTLHYSSYVMPNFTAEIVLKYIRFNIQTMLCLIIRY